MSTDGPTLSETLFTEERLVASFARLRAGITVRLEVGHGQCQLCRKSDGFVNIPERDRRVVCHDCLEQILLLTKRLPRGDAKQPTVKHVCFTIELE